MSEGIHLPDLPRPTLLPLSQRLERLAEALPQIRAVVEGEDDAVALQSTLACLLWETFVQANWCGFYRRIGDSMLAVGPYHGGMGCLRIPFQRGVCGACATSGEIQLVEDVRLRPGHIACDDRTLSELVLPVRDAQGGLRAVLDLDSPFLGGWDREEARMLESLLAQVFGGRVDWRG